MLWQARHRVVAAEPAAITPPSVLPPRQNLPVKLTRAAVSMVGAALLFAVMSVMVKLLSHSLPNAMVVFLRSSLSLVILLPAMLRHGRAALATQRLREHLLRGIAGMAAMYCFFFAIARLGLAEALLLNYSLPLFIPLVERAWLGEPTPRRVWPPIALGLFGLMLILKPGIGLFRPAALVGVVGAVLAATAQVGVRGLTRTESVTKIVFYFSIISTAIATGPALLNWRTPTVTAIPLLCALVTSATVAQLLMTRAYQLAPAAEVGPFIYASIAFAAALDWLLFAHHPDVLSAGGTLLVVVAGILALRRRSAASA